MNERCGLVLTDGSIVEVDNVAAEPARAYEMSPEQVLPYVQSKTIAATWHTHPDADPNLSGEDRAGFLRWPDLEHSIVGVRDGKTMVVTYRVEDGFVIECD